MPSIDDLIATYFVGPKDSTSESEPVPETFQDCRITPLIDCATYNERIEAALATVGTGADTAANADHFVLICNWWLGLQGGTFKGVDSILSSMGPQVTDTRPYTLDPPTNTRVLADILKVKAIAGVDVRVLGWVSFALMDSNIAQKSGGGGIAQVNAMTMKSAKDLRNEPALAKKVILNVIGHTAGGVHTKMVVIGNGTNAIGFTGGLDFEMGRFAHVGHPAAEIWHDVIAQVEGPAVQALYNHFQQMWTENHSRRAKHFRFEGADMPSFVPDTPPLAEKTLVIAPTGLRHRVQSLRTIPQFKYAWYNCLPENRAISYAPSGLFSYKLALQKALTAAQSYIYIEDQAYWSQEILAWANEAIKAHAGVRVILLMSGSADPNDTAYDDAAYLTASINHGLLEGLSQAQMDRVRIFRRMGDVVGPLTAPGGAVVTINVTAVADQSTTALVTLDQIATQEIRMNAMATAAPVIGQAGTAARIRLISDVDGTQRYDVVGNPLIQQGQPIVWQVRKGSSTTPVAGIYVLTIHFGVVVHAKTVIVDDNWAVVGSGNIMRRSLYTDIEHGVSFIDEDNAAVVDYRARLWADHYRHSDLTDFADIEAALHSWEPAWGVPGATPPRPDWLEPIATPVAEVAFTSAQITQRDKYRDLDSREDWGGLCP